MSLDAIVRHLNIQCLETSQPGFLKTLAWCLANIGMLDSTRWLSNKKQQLELHVQGSRRTVHWGCSEFILCILLHKCFSGLLSHLKLLFNAHFGVPCVYYSQCILVYRHSHVGTNKLPILLKINSGRELVVSCADRYTFPIQ